MRRLKRTYALPPETLERFERNVQPGQRSETVAALIVGWLEQREREALRAAVIEGCVEMSEVLIETAEQWEATDDEIWHSIDP